MYLHVAVNKQMFLKLSIPICYLIVFFIFCPQEQEIKGFFESPELAIFAVCSSFSIERWQSDVIDTFTSEDMENMFYEWYIFQ
jgi:hypothetical protein